MKNVLICGERSFVANGLIEKLNQNGLSYDCFSRGVEERNGNVVSGDILKIYENEYLEDYETVINFIVLKNENTEKNLEYIRALLLFCQNHQVKHLIHLSSISVYSNNAKYINEESEIELNPELKGGYGSIKVAVDQYLLNHSIPGMHISFVRPGYVYAKDHEVSKAGIIKSVFGINLLFGDKNTTLPLIDRALLHEALIKIVKLNEKHKVYLLLNNSDNNETKYNFVKAQWGGRVITLPHLPLISIANLFNYLKIIKPQLFSKIQGLFKSTKFDSSQTEINLNLKLNKKQFCVIGSGAYGSYICQVLNEKFPHEEIFLYEVGNENIKSEAEIGYLSKIKSKYTGLQKGRYFGLGGATVKWGGQLFTFSHNDFNIQTNLLKEIVDINIKWKNKLFARFNLKNNYEEVRISDDIYIKSGIWLGYFNRNLFKYFRINKKNNVHILSNRRVVNLYSEENNITGIEFIFKGIKYKEKYDHYFLAAGAFESARILINSKLIKNDTLPFSDHLSQRVFKVKSGTIIGNTDFRFRLDKTSLVMKRMVGEVDGVSFFCHPIYNSDFPFFQNLKKLLYGRQFSVKLIKGIVMDIPSCFKFAWNIIMLKQMYVYNNEYYLQIDIENTTDAGKIRLIPEYDKFGEKGVEVDFVIDQRTDSLFDKTKLIIKNYLDANHVIYEEFKEETKVEKYEDTYHPYGIFSEFNSVNEYFNCFTNMLVTNSGVLPRAGGINSTSAVMPLIEEYIENVL